jgi:MOSC domain-containing protein YiiM
MFYNGTDVPANINRIEYYKQGDKMPDIIAVCTSKKKGTRKENTKYGVVQEGFGLEGDAHADSNTHRQVSLLAVESIKKMQDLGLKVGPGDFAENFTTEGIDLVSLPVGTKLETGDGIVLEVTQIGKECHTKCAIYHTIGSCVMPEEGVFARVMHGGVVKAGDSIRIIHNGT